MEGPAICLHVPVLHSSTCHAAHQPIPKSDALPLIVSPQVLHCIENGIPLLIENLPADIDAVLDPVLGKQTIKRGRAVIMKIGDAEVEYDPKFRLYLQVRQNASRE